MADFTPHQIAKSINLDLKGIMRHPYVIDFMSSLDSKSRKQKDQDKLLISYLVGKCKMYADGWIMANALQTATLKENADYIQDLQDNIIPVYREMNNVVNKVILMVKDKLSEDDLTELRKLEAQIQIKLK